jgi:hypothetical protein
MTTTVKKSAAFIVPLLKIGFKPTIYTQAFIETYLKYGEEEIGRFLYLLYADDIESDLLEHFEKHPRFVSKIVPKDGKILIKLKIYDDEFTKVVEPFLAGQYSQIDREYVKSHFPPVGATRLQRMIFDKDPSLRTYWEDRIGVSLPEDAEVWDRVSFKDETYITHEKLDIEEVE